METIILPGFSVSNKVWAEEVKKNLAAESTVIHWPHWKTGKTEANWITKETQKIQEKYGDRQINIIAKSIGTVVAMSILKFKSPKVNKLILCGIPIGDLLSEDYKYFTVLKNFPTDNILCIQNENDNHGSFAQAEKLIHSISSMITVVSKSRADHEYPYFEDFNAFLQLCFPD